MQATNHKIDLQYQPTPTTCTQTALSMLIATQGQHVNPQELEVKVPQIKDEQGNDSGSLIQQAAGWCASENYGVELYSFDCQIVDQSWSELEPPEITKKIMLALKRDAPVVRGLGTEWTKAYRQAYVDYLQTGGKLIIQPAVTSQLIYELLANNPVMTCLCSNTLYGKSKVRKNGDENVPDSVFGRAWNHSVVIYGNDESGNLLIADPISGQQVIEPERMIAAISAAQIECDNMLFQITKA